MKLVCPQCQRRVDDFVIDLDPAGVRCAKCNAQIPADRLFTKSTVNHLQFLIPEDKRDAFFSELGFEQTPVRRTPRMALVFFIGFMVVPTLVIGVVSALSEQKPLRIAYAILGSVAFTWMILGYYRDEAKPKYRKKEA